MPKAQIIGRVAVKVLPETEGFRREAQRELDRIEKTLKVHVDATINENTLRKSALEAVNNLNRLLRSTNAYKVRFHATFSKSSLREAVSKAARDMEALARKERIEFDADINAAIAQVDGKLNHESLKKVEHQLKDWADDISPLDVGVDVSMIPGSAAVVSTRLRYLTRPRVVEILPKINNSAYASVATALAALSGARVLNDLLDGLWTRLKRLDKSVPIIGTVAEAIAGLSGWALTGASNLFALARSLAQIGPAALALPGILGGIAIGAGITIAALKDFNKVIPEFKKQLESLQDAISRNFWDKAEAPIRHMIDVLFPLFSKSAQQVATQIGQWFGNLATSMTEILSPILTGMMDDLAQSINVASKYTDHFVGVFATLGQLGAGYLPRLAEWFGEIFKSFDGFLRKAASDGSLERWVEMGLFQLKELGRAISELGGIFAGLARAAEKAGGSTLTMFADTLGRVHEVVDGEKFQRLVTGVLTSAHNAMETIAYKSGPAMNKFWEALAQTAMRIFPIMAETVGDALSAIAEALAQPEVNQGLAEMFLGLQTAVKALAPAMGPLARALGEVFSIVGKLASVIGPVVSVALIALSEVFISLSGPIKEIIDLLGGALLSVLQSISGPVQSLGSTLGNFFTKTLLPALRPLIEVFTELASAVLPIVIDGLSRLLVALTPLIEVIGQLVAQVGPVLVPALAFLAQVIVDSLVAAVEGVVLVIMGFRDVLSGVAQFISGVFSGDWSKAWNGIKQVGEGIWNLIKGAFQIFLNVGIFGVAKKLLPAIKAFFKSQWDNIGNQMKSLWEGLKSIFGNFLNFLKSKAEGILGAIKNVFSTIWNGIKSFLSGIWNSIKSLVAADLQSMRHTIDNGLDAIKGFFKNAWSAIRETAATWFSRIVGAVGQGVSDLLGKVSGIKGKILGKFKGAATWLWNAGVDIIKGLIDGIGSKIKALKDKLSGITDLIPKIKGPPERDAVLLKPAGQLIIEGLVEGMESRFDLVKKSLGTLTKDIAGTELAIPALSGGGNLTAHLAGVVGANHGGSTSNTQHKVLNYYAAPNNSLNAEEDLFAAAQRTRMVGW